MILQDLGELPGIRGQVHMFYNYYWKLWCFHKNIMHLESLLWPRVLCTSVSGVPTLDFWENADSTTAIYLYHGHFTAKVYVHSLHRTVFEEYLEIATDAICYNQIADGCLWVRAYCSYIARVTLASNVQFTVLVITLKAFFGSLESSVP